MVAKGRQSTTGSPKVEVGEVDTSSPIQSVKDAVSLFGEGAFSGEKPAIRKAKPFSAERVLAKETQLHLAQKELNKLKEKLNNTETTKAQALLELERAKRTVDDLNQKLKCLAASKELSVKETETAKNQVKKFEELSGAYPVVADGAQKQDLDSKREQYMSTITKLDGAKQLLRQIRQELHATHEAKAGAFKLTDESEHAAKVNMEKASELSKEINALQESIGQVRLATMEAHQEEAQIFAQKDAEEQTYRIILEELGKKLLTSKNEFDPELTKIFDAQLGETVTQIEALQKEIETVKVSDMNLVSTVTLELDGAKNSLHKIAEDESSLRDLVESLKLDLENLKREHAELKRDEDEMKSTSEELNVKLQACKLELETAIVEESRLRGASEEMISTLHQLSSEGENARCEAEEMEEKARELKKEAEAAKVVLEEAEEQLRVALVEAEEAKAAEESSLDLIKTLSARTDETRSSTSESTAQISISREEFEALSRKVEESDNLAEMKVAAALAEVEAVKASEKEALQKLEATQKEINDMKAATEEALKKAEMAEAAKMAVEGELRRWREREQKKAAEAASRILVETEMPSVSSPGHYRAPKVNPLEKFASSTRKLEKTRTSLSRKVLLPALSGLFHRKKSHADRGIPSYLPGEEPL